MPRAKMHFGKLIKGIGVALCAVLVVFLSESLLFDAFSCAAAQKVRAFLNPHSPGELPRQVAVFIDGAGATFCRGTPSYNQLIDLLCLKNSEEEVREAGPHPSLGSALRCGELTIWHLGLPFHCKIARSTINPNYLWIGIPYGNNRPGTAWPFIIDNGHLNQFVRVSGQPGASN